VTATINGSNSLTLNGNLTFSLGTDTLSIVNTGGTITLGGNLSGAGALTQNGSGGTLSLNGDNGSYSGTVTLTNGTLVDANGNANPLGTGAFNFNGGFLQGTAAATSAITNTVTVDSTSTSNVTATINGSNSLTLNGDLAFSLGTDTLAVVNTGSTITLGGNLSGAGALTQNGSGGTLSL